MPRRQQIRAIKMCAYCGGGYDAFKAMEVRGRYCSPDCLESARVAHRLHDAAAAGAADALSALGP